MWLVALAAAEARDPIWGAGIAIGTNGIPGRYPSGFPKVLKTYDFDDDPDGLADDVDGDGTPDASTLEKVGGDVLVGLEGAYWVNDALRLGLRPQLDAGRRYLDLAALLSVDATFVDGDQLDLFAGGAIGAGTARWKGKDPQEQLVLPHYPLQAEVGAHLVPSEVFAPSLRLFGRFDLPSSHRYTDVGGKERDRSELGPGLYAAVGIELALLFGNLD